MATGTLTSTTIAARYKSLLKLTGTANDVLAADASAKYVEDGDGNDSVFSLSTTRVGIGNTAPTALLTAGAIVTLVTDGTTAVTPEGVNVHITEASKYAMGIKNADASGDGLIIQAGDAADDFALRVEDYDSANDLLVVQGGGNVGIGTAAPDNLTHIYAGDASQTSNTSFTQLTVENSGHSGIGILSGTNSYGTIYFGDDGSTSAGIVQYGHGSQGDILTFGTAGAIGMTISGTKVGIGVSPSAWSTGSTLDIGILGSGGFWGSGANAMYWGDNWYYDGGYKYKTTLTANRFASDSGGFHFATAPSNSGSAGDAATFTTRFQVENAGNVTVSTGNLIIGTAGKGIDFSNQASPAAGMSSELLDRYEEGTWTMTANNSVTLHSNSDLGSYTRVGRLVTCAGQARVNDDNSTADLSLNLPFTSLSTLGEGANLCQGALSIYQSTSPASVLWGVVQNEANSIILQFSGQKASAATTPFLATANGYYTFTISYMAA
jgi:hypothetical protein